jgi:hypothetical protein
VSRLNSRSVSRLAKPKETELMIDMTKQPLLRNTQPVLRAKTPLTRRLVPFSSLTGRQVEEGSLSIVGLVASRLA